MDFAVGETDAIFISQVYEALQHTTYLQGGDVNPEGILGLLDGSDAGTSALGLVDPKDARFKGDMAAAQLEARNDAKRQLVEKALALHVEGKSLDGNYGLLQARLLSNSGAFIRSVLQEGAASTGKDGLVEMQTRAVVSLRDVQKSLNQLSREERVEFIRNKGDPRISIRIDVGNAEGAALGRERSHLAENIVKDRIKSFGFRVWSGEGDNPAAASAQQADFAIRGPNRFSLTQGRASYLRKVRGYCRQMGVSSSAVQDRALPTEETETPHSTVLTLTAPAENSSATGFARN